jgi:hypothetical protein
VFVLREGEAAGRFDLTNAQRPVRTRAGQNHADRVLALDCGQGPQEMIHRVVRPAVIGTRRDREHAVGDRDARIRLNHVDVIGRDLGAMAGVNHGHGRVWPQEFRQPAFVLGIQMLDDDQRQSWTRWQRRHQMRDRTESAGRCANADDREGILGGLSHPGEYRCQRSL